MKRRSPRGPRPAPLLDLMQAPATTDISRLESLLNWRLLRGSHQFPGPAGGTCILEAAVVVAGLPYRRVESSADAPPDFSPTLSAYLLLLNDLLPHEPRQRLIPFVTRLAGTADCKAVEDQREQRIAAQTAEHIMPVVLTTWQRTGKMFSIDRPMSRLGLAARLAAWTVERASQEATAVMDRVVAIADEALALGSQAEAIEPLAALVRLEAVRPQPPRRAVAKAA